MSARLFTSESVTEGHPDKICDQISDSILDAMLAQDPGSRVAVETMVTTGLVHVAGEVTTEAYVEIPKIVRDTVLGIGYDSSTKGFDGASCGVEVSIGQQSPDIAQGVDTAYENRTGGVDPLDKQGAGDQGLMFGYACEDTAELMPLPIHLAHRLAERLTAVRKSGEVAYLRPDGKTQVTIGYDGDKAVRLDTVVLSTQHAEDISLDGLLAPDIIEHVIKPVLAELADEGTELDALRLPHPDQPDRQLRHRRPDGRRRPHRSQDHRRHLRRHVPPRWRRVLRQGPVEGRPLGRLRHALGRQERRRRGPGPPLRGPGRLRHRQGPAGRPLRRDLRHRDACRSTRSRPPSRRSSTCARARIVQDLDLLRPIYKPTAAYGHFGRTEAGGVDNPFTWERTDRVDALQKAVKG